MRTPRAKRVTRLARPRRFMSARVWVTIVLIAGALGTGFLTLRSGSVALR
jgi:hypothetical protein